MKKPEGADKYTLLLIPSIIFFLWVPILLIHLFDPVGFDNFLRVASNPTIPDYFIFIAKLFIFVMVEFLMAFSGMIAVAYGFCKYYKKNKLYTDTELREIVNFSNRNSGNFSSVIEKIYEKLIFKQR